MAYEPRQIAFAGREGRLKHYGIGIEGAARPELLAATRDAAAAVVPEDAVGSRSPTTPPARARPRLLVGKRQRDPHADARRRRRVSGFSATASACPGAHARVAHRPRRGRLGRRGGDRPVAARRASGRRGLDLRDRLDHEGVHCHPARRHGARRARPHRRSRLRHHLPPGVELPSRVREITLADLSSHRSGLPALPRGLLLPALTTRRRNA